MTSYFCWLCHICTTLVDHRTKILRLYILAPRMIFVGAPVFIFNRSNVCAVPSNPVRPFLSGLSSDAADSWPLRGAIGQRPLSYATFFLPPFGAFTLALSLDMRLGSCAKLRVVTSVIGVCC